MHRKADWDTAAETVETILPNLPIVKIAKASALLLTAPEVTRVADMVRWLAADHAVLMHQTDAAGASNVFSPSTETFDASGAVGSTAMANPETAVRACLGLMRACVANDFGGGAEFRRHRDSTHLVIMAVPKRFFSADRPIRHDDVDDLLIDMARDGLIPNWGMPYAWIRATVDCRGGIPDIRENPDFDADRYDTAMPAKDLVGFPNLLIRAR